MNIKGFFSSTIFWYKQAIFSWITYVAITCIIALFYLEGVRNTFLMMSGGIVASSIFYFFLVKIPQTKHARQMSKYTKNLYLYKKNIIATIIDKCVPTERHHLQVLTDDPKILAEYLALENNSKIITENIFIYKEQILNEINFLFLTLSRYVNLDFVAQDITLFNITNDYIHFLEGITLTLTSLEKYSDHPEYESMLIKTLTELLCGSSLLLSPEGKDFFLEEIDRFCK